MLDISLDKVFGASCDSFRLRVRKTADRCRGLLVVAQAQEWVK